MDLDKIPMRSKEKVLPNELWKKLIALVLAGIVTIIFCGAIYFFTVIVVTVGAK